MQHGSLDSQRGSYRMGIFAAADENTHHPITVVSGDNSLFILDDFCGADQKGFVDFSSELSLVGIYQSRRTRNVSVEYGCIQLHRVVAKVQVFRFWNDFAISF